jgi:hypothetical protein
MTWADFYLISFLLGFGLSLVSVLGGVGHVHLPHVHLPHLHVHAGSDGAPINFGTVAAFLAWFGGTGYLLSRYYRVWFLPALGIALLSGLGGAAVVFWFLAKVLISKEENLDPADYEMVGVLGTINSPVRVGGTGELVFSQAGCRRACGVRSEDGVAIPKGAEVVVTRYEKGIAYVRRWEDLTAPQRHSEEPQ